MGLYGAYKTDEALEKRGVWYITSSDPNTRILLARAGNSNKPYAKLLEAKTKPFRRMIAHNMMPAEKQREILREVYAETVILGWQTLPEGADPNDDAAWTTGIEQPGGSLAEPTKDVIIRVLTELPDLFVELQEAANEQAMYRATDMELAAKN